MPIDPTPITPLPTPVPSSTDPATFDARADALLGALPTAVTEMNAAMAVTYDNAVEALDAVVQAQDAVVQCEAAIEVANQVAGAGMWNPATNYATGDPAVSPTNMATYRRNAPGGVDATDPAASALWTVIGAVPVFANQAEAEAGTANNRLLSPLSFRQATRAAGAAPVFPIRAYVRVTQGTGTYSKATTNGPVVVTAGADVADVGNSASVTYTSGGLNGNSSMNNVSARNATTFTVTGPNIPGVASGNCSYFILPPGGNVATISKNSTGNYTATFTTPIAGRYAVFGTLGGAANTTGGVFEPIENTMTSTGFSFTCVTTSNSYIDPSHINIIVVGIGA